MNKKEKALECKINLCKDISDSLNQKNNSMMSSANLFVITGTILSAVNIVYEDKATYDVMNILNIICLIGPCMILAFLFWFSMFNRSVAITQGYLAGLEDSINMELRQRIYQTNSYYHKLYSIKYFPSNNIVSVLYSMIIIVLSLICFYNMFKYKIISYVFIILYLVAYIAFLIILILELNSNAKIRNIARSYFHYIIESEDIDELTENNYLKYRIYLKDITGKK